MVLFSVLMMSNVYAKQPLLVIDALNVPEMPTNFRTTAMSFPEEANLTQQGLLQLKAIGSAQFSQQGLSQVINLIHSPITIIDLRQESHGFIDGNAVSWYASRDWANIDKTPTEVEQDQQQRLAELAKQTRFTLNKITNKNTDGQVISFKSTVFNVKEVMPETELAKQLNLGYLRLYITDGWIPDSIQVDRFVALVKTLPKDTWLYFHCRAGKGRTTSFMSMYDMMRNAKEVSFNNIIQRQYRLGGIDLAKMPSTNSYNILWKLSVFIFCRIFITIVVLIKMVSIHRFPNGISNIKQLSQKYDEFYIAKDWLSGNRQ